MSLCAHADVLRNRLFSQPEDAEPEFTETLYCALVGELTKEMQLQRRLPEAPYPDDWRPRTVDLPFGLEKLRLQSSLQARVIQTLLSWWLTVGRVQPCAIWDDGVKEFRRGWTGGLWGALGLHLLYAVWGTKGGGTCTNCGRLVRHKRAPKAGQRVWCERKECRRALNLAAKYRSRTARR